MMDKFRWEQLIYNKYKCRELTGTKAMEQLGLKRNTFYGLIKEWEENLKGKNMV